MNTNLKSNTKQGLARTMQIVADWLERSDQIEPSQHVARNTELARELRLSIAANSELEIPPKERAEALCHKWIEEEREYDRRCKEAANKGNVQELAVYGSKRARIHICRRELQEAAGLVVLLGNQIYEAGAKTMDLPEET